MKQRLFSVGLFLFLLFTTAPMSQAKTCTGSHSWSSWETVKQATYSHEGQKSRKCNVCEEVETKSIDKKTGNSDKEAIIKNIKTYIKGAKSYDQSKMSKCFASPSSAKKKFATWNWLVKVYRRHNKNIQYDITNINVNKKKGTATAKVQVTTGSIWSSVVITFDETVEYILKHPSSSSSKQTSYARSRLKHWYRKIGLYDDTDTRTVTFKYVKKNNKWKIKTPTVGITDIANLRYDKALKDAQSYY